MSDYILSWQLLKKKPLGNAYAQEAGGAIAVNDIEGPGHALIYEAITLTALDMKDKIV